MNLFGWLKRSKTKREIIVNVEKLETRVAVVENGRLEEFMVEHREEERLVGSVFKGRVQNLENDLQAAFVDIGLKKNAFLHYWDMTPDADSILDDDDDAGRGKNAKKANRLSDAEIAKLFPPGSEIIVQVTKGPISTKGPRVVANLSIPGRYLVMMPGAKDSRGATLRGVSKKIGDAKERQRLKKIIDKLPLPENVGLVVRTVGQGASARAFARDLRNLLSVWNEMQANTKNLRTPCCIFQEPDLCERVVRDWLTEDIDAIVIDDAKSYEEMREVTGRISRRAKSKIRRYDGNVNIFEHYGLERQLSDAFARKVPLKSGGYLVIDETEALIAVDVNTGHYKGKGSQEESILEVNLEAVEEVARQLRLRNIGGLVILDLIDMKSRKHQKQVYRALKDALKRDRARTNVLEISELGLLEMSRQRQDQSILSMLTSNCPYCQGHGVIKSPMAISIEVQRHLTTLLKKAAADKKPFEPKIVIAPQVMQRLRTDDSEILAKLQNDFNTRLTFVSELHRHPESFSILDAATSQVLYSQS
ncbi:MAG: Rne/Rng family ribonuclease [Kiritimatiellae bacterium]|nr:Rne/Rng family ribonuclease [Kiritimatiellia bacterium]MBR3776432.1 Rne/Rng family ribonuclease [Kiritimatiellia bacterium]